VLGLVVVVACQPRVLRLSLISHVLNASSGL